MPSISGIKTHGTLTHPSGSYNALIFTSCRNQIKPIDKRLDGPHRVLRTNGVVQGFWQQQRLGSVVTGDVRHAEFSIVSPAAPVSTPPSFHTVCLNSAKDPMPPNLKLFFVAEIGCTLRRGCHIRT
jgi:hypothetical protein